MQNYFCLEIYWEPEVFRARAAGFIVVNRRPKDLQPKAEVTSGEGFRASHFKDLTETGKCTEQSLATREALKLSNAL